MKKTVAINTIRESQTMQRLSPSEWIFTFSGKGQFAAINLGSDNLYYAHSKGVRATTHKTFMAAVASLLDCYLKLVHEAVNTSIRAFKDLYNSIECVRYLHSNEMGKFVVCNEMGLVQNVDGGISANLSCEDIALFSSKVAAMAANKYPAECETLTLESAINRESKRIAGLIKDLQTNLPDNGQVVTFEA